MNISLVVKFSYDHITYLVTSAFDSRISTEQLKVSAPLEYYQNFKLEKMIFLSLRPIKISKFLLWAFI